MLDPDFSLRDVSPSAQAVVFLLQADAICLRFEQTSAVLPSFAELSHGLGEQADSFLQDAIYLGRLQARDCFLICADTLTLPALPDSQWLPLRQAFVTLDAAWFAMLGRAMQLRSWLHDQAFCGRCGNRCQRHAKEFALVCEGCNLHQYPRINPCIIVLITKGEKALLAHGVRFPDGLYSCLAGFVEAGENAEQAVRREVLEEVGIELAELRYHGSQSWPFPHSLMLGFHAQWRAGEITPDADEILAADWFTPESLPRLPTSGSIAREMIDAWLAEAAIPT